MQIWIQALNKYIEQLTNEVQNQFRTGIVPVQGETSLSLCRLLNRVQAANLMRIRIRNTGFHLFETKALKSYIFAFKQNKKYIVVPFLLVGLRSNPYGTMAEGAACGPTGALRHLLPEAATCIRSCHCSCPTSPQLRSQPCLCCRLWLSLLQRPFTSWDLASCFRVNKPYLVPTGLNWLVRLGPTKERSYLKPVFWIRIRFLRIQMLTRGANLYNKDLLMLHVNITTNSSFCNTGEDFHYYL